MARKLRLESKGGVYHILNHGSKGLPLFRAEKAREVFLHCLNEACEKTRWRVHAWCLTSNGYHLALETPEANLVEGMHWFQGAFSARFNEQRQTSGRLFRDRYKSLLVDPAGGLGALCDFIHLQPVLTRAVPLAQLGSAPATSVSWLVAPSRRATWYNPAAALNQVGERRDNTAGRKKYVSYLTGLATDEAGQARLRFGKMSKGWLIGTGKFAKKMQRDHGTALGQGEKLARKRQNAQELVWQETMEQLLRKLGRSKKALAQEGKSADWKLALAAALKSRTTVTNRWLGTALQMGNLYEVSRKVAAWIRQPDVALAKKLS